MVDSRESSEPRSLPCHRHVGSTERVRRGRPNMSVAACVTDSAGCLRIPHKNVRIKLDPCKCKRQSGQCCSKGYCPCKKAGYYCGPACACYHNGCGCSNRELQDEVEHVSKKPKLEVQEETLLEEGEIELTAEDIENLSSLGDFDFMM